MTSAPQNKLDQRPSSITVDDFTSISWKYIGDGSIFAAARELAGMAELATVSLRSVQCPHAVLFCAKK